MCGGMPSAEQAQEERHLGLQTACYRESLSLPIHKTTYTYSRERCAYESTFSSLSPHLGLLVILRHTPNGPVSNRVPNGDALEVLRRTGDDAVTVKCARVCFPEYMNTENHRAVVGRHVR